MIWKGLMVVTGSESPIVVVLRYGYYNGCYFVIVDCCNVRGLSQKIVYFAFETDLKQLNYLFCTLMFKDIKKDNVSKI